MAGTNVGTTKMIKTFLFGLLAGAFGTVMAMQYHVVRTHERFMVVARIHQPPVRTAYVDVREWTPAMWEHYPELSDAIVKAGRPDLLTRDGRAASPQAIPTSHSGSQMMGHPFRQQASPQPGVPQQEMPHSAIPTSIPRVPPTAQHVHSFQTAGLEALAVTTPPPMDPTPSRREQPVGQSSYLPPSPMYGPDQIRDTHASQGNAPERNTEPAKRSWFGSILDSVIPKVGESVKENASGFHSAAAVISEQFEQLQAQRIEFEKEQARLAQRQSQTQVQKQTQSPKQTERQAAPDETTETLQVANVLTDPTAKESSTVEIQQSWKSVSPMIQARDLTNVASDIREDFPSSPRRVR